VFHQNSCCLVSVCGLEGDMCRKRLNIPKKPSDTLAENKCAPLRHVPPVPGKILSLVDAIYNPYPEENIRPARLTMPSHSARPSSPELVDVSWDVIPFLSKRNDFGHYREKYDSVADVYYKGSVRKSPEDCHELDRYRFSELPSVVANRAKEEGYAWIELRELEKLMTWKL
jgi:hypothetical protein